MFDEENICKNKHSTRQVSKLDVVKEQLSDAIYLMLNNGSNVSVHTLVMASYQIIYDILPDDSDMKEKSIFNFDNPYIKENCRKEFINQIKRAMNFFKHADKDGLSEIEFYYEVNEIFVLMTLGGLMELDYSDFCKREDLYFYHFYLTKKYPNLFERRKNLSEKTQKLANIIDELVNKFDFTNINIVKECFLKLRGSNEKPNQKHIKSRRIRANQA